MLEEEIARAVPSDQAMKNRTNVMRPLTWTVLVMFPEATGMLLFGDVTAQVCALVLLAMMAAHFCLTYARWFRRAPDRLGTDPDTSPP